MRLFQALFAPEPEALPIWWPTRAARLIGAVWNGQRIDRPSQPVKADPSMVTNVMVDDPMVKEAVKPGHFKTKHEAMHRALTEFVQRRNQRRLLERVGKIEFRPDWDYK